MNKKGRLYQKGRLCFRFLLAAAVVAAALYSYSALASNPTAIPGILADNETIAPGSVSAQLGGAL